MLIRQPQRGGLRNLTQRRSPFVLGGISGLGAQSSFRPQTTFRPPQQQGERFEYALAPDIRKAQRSLARKNQFQPTQAGFDRAMNSGHINNISAYLYDPRFRGMWAANEQNDTAKSMMGNIEDAGSGYFERDRYRNTPSLWGDE